MSHQQVNRRTIRPARIAEKLGVSLPTLWRYHRTDASFPRMFKLTAGATVCFEDEIDAWVQSRRTAALPARTLRAPKPLTTNAPAAPETLMTAIVALRAAGLHTLDDLARELQATTLPSKARGSPAKAPAAPKAAADADPGRKRRTAAAVPIAPP